jgi:undecaprenyl-diphosphatase
VEELYRLDLSGFRAIHLGLHESWLDPVFLVLTYTGLSNVQIVLSLLLLCWKSTRNYVFPLLLVIFISGLPVAQGVKHLIERERPSNLAMAHPQEPIFYNSFPSGHTTTAFACGFLILLLTWGTPRAKWGWLAVVWAFLVGLSRIYRGVHWPSDVAAGIFAGLFSAAFVFVLVGKLVPADYSPEASR